jgi:hypothetical protein
MARGGVQRSKREGEIVVNTARDRSSTWELIKKQKYYDHIWFAFLSRKGQDRSPTLERPRGGVPQSYPTQRSRVMS